MRTSAIVAAILLGVLLTSVILSIKSLSNLVESEGAVSKDLTIENTLKDLLSQILNAETGQRGFLLTGQSGYLDPYYTALNQIRDLRTAIIALMAHEPDTLGQLGALDTAMSIKLRELDRTISLKNAGNSDAAIAVVGTGAGRQSMEAIRDAVRLLVANVDSRRDRAQRKHSEEIRNSYWIMSVFLLLNFALLAGLVRRMRLAAAQGRAGQQLMQLRNDALSLSLEVAAIRNEQVHGLSELGQLLQACVSMEEAVGLLRQHIPSLMKAGGGAMYLYTASINQLDKAFQWGAQPYGDRLEPASCWALRLGKLYRQPADASAGTCMHLSLEHPPVSDSVYCLPLMVHGELTALLVVETNVAVSPQQFSENEVYRRIAPEQSSLSIGNLKLRDSLRQQSIRDMLTGLYNRRFFEESALRELVRASRLQAQGSQDDLALLMVDIDHFKRINDEHGHNIGDQVLRDVAQALQHESRGSLAETQRFGRPDGYCPKITLFSETRFG